LPPSSEKKSKQDGRTSVQIYGNEDRNAIAGGGTNRQWGLDDGGITLPLNVDNFSQSTQRRIPEDSNLYSFFVLRKERLVI
jgi:hypothetical protein